MGLLLSCLRGVRGRWGAEASDELLAGEELRELLAALALVLTIVPAVRAGRSTAESTLVQAPSRPTASASMSRSSRSRDSTGFFLAAMMPLKDG